MVVVAILAILLGAVLKVTSSVMNNANMQQTKAIMFNLEQAIDQFKLDAPLKGVKDYRDRYGGYPCDELDAFVKDAIPIKPNNKWRAIGPGQSSELNFSRELKDISDLSMKAMALTIRLYSPGGGAILDRISPKYRRPPRDPQEFFDRDGDGDLDIDDVPLIYFVDSWGTPFEYFAVNPNEGSDVDVAAPSDSRMRLKTSKYLVSRNRGQALLVSYGPSGPEQFSRDFRDAAGNPLDLIRDYTVAFDGSLTDLIDHPLNNDNVYLDDTLKERLKQP